MSHRTDERRRKLILIVVVVCYLYPFPYFENLNNPNEHVRLYMTMAVVEGGTFAIDEPCRRFGWVNDRSRRGEHFYAGKAPGASLLGVPVYAVASWISGGPLSRPAAIRVLRLVTVTLPCLVFLFILRRFLDELPGAPWLKDTLFLAYSLGSMAYAYGLMFTGHQLAAVALTGALIVFYRIGQRLEAGDGALHWRAVGAGLLLGAAPAMEYPAVVGALVVLAAGEASPLAPRSDEEEPAEPVDDGKKRGKGKKALDDADEEVGGPVIVTVDRTGIDQRILAVPVPPGDYRDLEAGDGALHGRAVGAGLLLGAAPAMEYPAVVGALVVGVYGLIVIRRRPALVATLCPALLVPAALVAGFHTAAFGSPFAFPYDFIENPAFQRLLAEGWHGATYPHPDRLATILVSPGFGLVFFTPLLVLAPVGWVVMARGWRDRPPHQRHLVWVLPAVSVLLVGYLASSALWRAGWAVGPRYIATAVPFLALSALVGASALLERAPVATSLSTAVLAVLSLVHGGTSGALYPHQPEPFDNPVYDLNLRLIDLGFAPHHALEWIGLRGHLALLPLGLAAAIAIVLVALGPPRPRPGLLAAHAAVVLLVATLSGLALSRYGDDTEGEARMWALVVRTWEPLGFSAPERRLAAFETLEAPGPADLRAAADDHDLLGQRRQADALRRRAVRLEREQRLRPIEERTLLPSLQLNPDWGAEEP